MAGLQARGLSPSSAAMPTPSAMVGKTVLVTGASGGIGLATANALAGLGARVGIVGRDRQRLKTVAEHIGAQQRGATVEIFVADLST